MADDDDTQLATGRIKLASLRLAGRYPFHAAVVSQWVVEPLEGVKTMGVTLRCGTVHLLFEPDFVLEISLAELVGVLLHEIHHVVFGHLLEDRSGFEDLDARVVAEEVTANEWINEPLPGRPMLLEDYPLLPTNEDTDQRYERLRRKHPRGRTIADAGGSKPLDNHDHWPPVDEHGAAASLAVAGMLATAARKAGPEVMKSVSGAVLEALEKAIGSVPGQGLENVGDRGEGVLDWRGALARIVGRVLRVEPRLGRVPRRLPHLVGVLPGRVRRLTRPTVMAVLDTSGSVSSSDLDDMAAELRSLHAHAEVLVVECDAVIYEVYPFTGSLDRVHGRGGTDLRPPFAPQFLREHRPDAMIYMTDGFGPAPKKPPSIPVFWCLTGGGVQPASWGRVLRIRD